MKYILKMMVIITVVFLTSCNSGSTKNETSDSLSKTPDTTGQQMVQGSPGASGTQPSPSDTTQAHRDSLTRARHISDSASQPAVK